MTQLALNFDAPKFGRPVGFNPEAPNCGVTAVAIAAGVTFQVAWDILKKIGNRNGNWKGVTYVHQQVTALKELGVKYQHNYIKGRPTLQQWVQWETKPGVTYMVVTTGHVQVVKDGKVVDQTPEPVHYTKFWGARKKVREVIEIL